MAANDSMASMRPFTGVGAQKQLPNLLRYRQISTQYRQTTQGKQVEDGRQVAVDSGLQARPGAHLPEEVPAHAAHCGRRSPVSPCNLVRTGAPSQESWPLEPAGRSSARWRRRGPIRGALPALLAAGADQGQYRGPVAPCTPRVQQPGERLASPSSSLPAKDPPLLRSKS